ESPLVTLRNTLKKSFIYIYFFQTPFSLGWIFFYDVHQNRLPHNLIQKITETHEVTIDSFAKSRSKRIFSGANPAIRYYSAVDKTVNMRGNRCYPG
ncbi:MAG: hypothetical protein WBA74_23985, partial [Cyclobacteriaceae bacterium]